MNKSLKWHKQKCWKWFSLWTRLRYSTEEGYVMCVTCHGTKHYKEMQAGHGLSGRNNAVLFHEDLVYPQCYGCNVCQSGCLDIYQKFLIDKYGLEKWNELLKLKKAVRKYTIPELQELTEKYKNLVKEDNRYEP